MRKQAVPPKHEIDALEHIILANKCVRRDVRVTDLGATKAPLEGKFKVLETRTVKKP